MNTITIVGNLGKDAETKSTPSQMQVTEFSVATSIGWGDKKETQWFRVTCFGERWAKMSEYLLKGKTVMVVGEFKLEEWTDREGNNKSTLKVTADKVNFIAGSKSSEGDKNLAEKNKSWENEKIDPSYETDDIPF